MELPEVEETNDLMCIILRKDGDIDRVSNGKIENGDSLPTSPMIFPPGGIVTLADDRRDKSSIQSRSRRSSHLARLHDVADGRVYTVEEFAKTVVDVEAT